MSRWSNWSGSVAAAPQHILTPSDEQALADAVAHHDRVRCVGAGHSFTPLCDTNGALISLSGMQDQTLVVAPDRATVSAPAGWTLKHFTAELWKQGLSLANQGDINAQSLAGAISTGTHGAGLQFGSLSTMVRGARFVDAAGSIRLCSRSVEPGMFAAARLSLGLLGVITRLDFAVTPAFWLEERLESRPFDALKEDYLSLTRAHRHVEFFVFPYAKHAILKRLNVVAAPEVEEKLRDADMDESLFRLVCDACALAPGMTGRLQSWLAPSRLKAKRIGPAHKIYASERTVKFEEMEFAMAPDAALHALDVVIKDIRDKQTPIAFPFEVRIVAGDDVWLSPFNRGPAISVSMHQYAKMPWKDAFAKAEQIFLAHGGRPHWGKRHTLAPRDVHALYPDAERFLSVRAQLDPTGKFLNAYLKGLFEIPTHR